MESTAEIQLSESDKKLLFEAIKAQKLLADPAIQKALPRLKNSENFEEINGKANKELE